MPELPSSQVLFGYARDLCAIGARRPGTPEDDEAQAYLLERFEALGLENVRKEPVRFHLWEPAGRRLDVHTNDRGFDLDTEWLHLSAFTDAEGVHAELVDVGAGSPEAFQQADVRGKIVLADITYGEMAYEQLKHLATFVHDPDDSLAGKGQPTTWLVQSQDRILKLAEENGAVGVVLAFPFAMRPFLFCRDADPMTGAFYNLPGLVLTKPEAKRLREMIRGRKSTATLVQTGQVKPGLTYNIVGELPGQTDEVILIGSHHDSMWEGATEDAVGCAAVLGLAGYFSQFPASSLKRTLVFNLDAAEQIQVLGARAFVEQHGDDLLSRLLVEVHVEHIAWEVLEDEAGQVRKTGELQARALFVADDPRFRMLAKEMVEEHDLRRTVILPTDTPLGVPTDATSYDEAGYPVISLISAPIYWNTDADTLDKIPVEETRRVTHALADLVRRLDQL